ncbi:hypothetical protein ASF61_18360 [Duganella sp. Leaf126]|uniref:hypothetical protein n=1 Tax=Duganella sp. Leaf126 TaxID=1736266 RepID=UPI0006FB71B1|nr:hypothetical protein [Duganella sp. Leaf126]KQQ46360.1 hypothetical protein ASF61_18360 [Duganella sp. Leaf126]
MLACGVVLLALFAPALVFGARASDDIPWHFIWLQSYLDAVRHGELYPRWMPDAMAGMGSPAFYFYPPFATMFFALVDMIFLHQLPLAYVIAVSACAMGLASAAFFYSWARNFASVRVSALLGLAYAAAPYHLLTDYYNRGALGEYAAYVWVPLIFHAAHRYLVTAGVRWLALLAAAVTGLFFTHLLSAMIVGPVIAAYVLLALFGRQRRGNAGPGITVTLASMVAVALLAVGVAGLYFIPALTLFDAANTAALYARPIEATRLFARLSVHDNPVVTRYTLFAAIYLALTAYLLAEYLRARRRAAVAPAGLGTSGATVLMWTVVTALCGLFMWGKLGFVFEAPSPYRSLQFLSRLLIVVEFVLLTLVAVVFAVLPAPAERQRIASVLLLVFAGLLVYQALALFKKFEHMPIAVNEVALSPRVQYRITPPEYYPKGAPFASAVDQLLPQLAPHLDASEQAWIVDGSGRIETVAQSHGDFVLRVTAATAVSVAIRQFYFPGWVAQDQQGRRLPVTAATPFRFATVQVGAGTHTLRIAREPLPVEGWAKKLSSLSLALLLMVLGALGWAARRRASRAAPAMSPATLNRSR